VGGLLVADQSALWTTIAEFVEARPVPAGCQ